jgi:hypothetical protein
MRVAALPTMFGDALVRYLSPHDLCRLPATATGAALRDAAMRR